MQNFEVLFEVFLDSAEYDKAESALFSLVRMAFKAGWQAAEDKSLKHQKPIQLVDAKYKHLTIYPPHPPQE